MWCGHWRDDRDIKNASHDKTATHTQFWLPRTGLASGLYNRTVREREREVERVTAGIMWLCVRYSEISHRH